MKGTVCLGPRLSLVASYVPELAKLGDIGTDHAYLPIFLWEQTRIARAIAVDIHEGPYQSAREAINRRGLDQWIDVRFGDGLKPIQPGEVDTLTLAGMGGNTMLEIFEARPDVLAQVNTLILQPQGAEGKVRKALLNAGWLLQDEALTTEEGRIYGVMVYSRQRGKAFEEFEELSDKWFRRLEQKYAKKQHANSGIRLQELQKIEDIQGMQVIFEKVFWGLGPLILEQPGPELERLIQEQIEPLQQVIKEMGKSQKDEIRLRIRQYEITCSLLKEMKECLFPSL